MGGAVVQVNKAARNPDAREACGKGSGYNFVTGVGGIAPDVHRPAKRVRPCAASTPCCVVLGRPVSTSQNKRDACNFPHPVKACKGIRVHIALFAGRAAA